MTSIDISVMYNCVQIRYKYLKSNKEQVNYRHHYYAIMEKELEK